MQAIAIEVFANEEQCPPTLRSVGVAAQRGGWTVVHREDGMIVAKHVSGGAIVVDGVAKEVDDLSDRECVAALTVAWQEHAGIFRAIRDRVTESGDCPFPRAVLGDFLEFFSGAFGQRFVADTTGVPDEDLRLTLAQISTRPAPKSFVRERA